MSAEIVIKKLGSYEHFGFKWIAAGSGGFHHDAPYLQGGLHARMVERMSIAAVKLVNNALTDVHFGTPAWHSGMVTALPQESA